MKTEKNMVIALAKGYNWYVLEHFFRSFVKHFKNTDMVLFLDDCSDFTRYQLEQTGKEIQGGELKLISYPEELKSRNPANARFKAFADYVNEHADEYDQIFMSDTRDVFFQGNIFDCYKNNGKYLACAQEDFAGPIGYYRGNDISWLYEEVVDVHGKEEADKLSDKFNFAPSTIAGTAEEMKIFLNKLWEYMPKDYDFYTLDAVTEWYILYNKLVPVENIIEARCDGPIVSADWYYKLTPIKIENDLLLNADGKAPAVVHQYDRHEILMDFADKLYRKPLEQPDKRFTDVKSSLDQMLHLVRNESLINAMEFFTDNLLEKDNFFGYAAKLIDCWEILLSKENSTVSVEILNIALQRKIMVAFKDGLYIKLAEKIASCLRLCKNKKIPVTFGFEDWLTNSFMSAAKWHFSHSNFPRYEAILRFMVEMNLTDNEYFCFMQADFYRSLGLRETAARYYERALKYQNKDKFEKQKLLALYWQKMVEETKFFPNPIPNIIQPSKGDDEIDLVFNKYNRSFVKIKN